MTKMHEKLAESLAADVIGFDESAGKEFVSQPGVKRRQFDAECPPIEVPPEPEFAPPPTGELGEDEFKRIARLREDYAEAIHRLETAVNQRLMWMSDNGSTAALDKRLSLPEPKGKGDVLQDRWQRAVKRAEAFNEDREATARLL